MVKSILSEYKIHNADVTLRYDATADDLIDVIEGNRSYIPCIYLLNKIGELYLTLIYYKLKHYKFLRYVNESLCSYRPNQHRGVGHYLQDSSLCSHIGSS